MMIRNGYFSASLLVAIAFLMGGNRISLGEETKAAPEGQTKIQEKKAPPQEGELKTMEKEYTLKDFKVKAKVPVGWEERYSPEMGYVNFEKEWGTHLQIESTCHGSCDPAKIKANIEEVAKERLDFLGSPRHVPKLNASFIKKGEVKPGVHLFLIHGKEESGAKEKYILSVDTYKEGWKGIFSCNAQVYKKDPALVEALEKLCMEVIVQPL